MRAFALLLGLLWAPAAFADEAPPSSEGCKCDSPSAAPTWAPLVLIGLALGRRRR